jgi:hypothetical protein
LAGNFYTSDYSALCSSLSIKRLGQHQARHGKYGPTWGYDTKRSNWVKGKVYDKTAEQQGRRTVTAGPTDARFEIQLGSEYLKRHQLDHVSAWSDETMDKIIYGKFASQLFRETASAEDWSNIPPRLRQYAILWRDGTDIRSIISKAQFYKTRAKLLDGFGIDIATPCNVIALTRHVRIIEVMPLPALRREAA